VRRLLTLFLLVSSVACSSKGILPFEFASGPAEDPAGVTPVPRADRQPPPAGRLGNAANPANGAPEFQPSRAIPPGAAGAPGTLRTIAASRGLLVGAAVAWEPMTHDAAYAQVLAKHFSYVTPENAMKWGLVQPTPDARNYFEADEIVARAMENGQQVKGHTLVWHDTLPPWIGPDTPPDAFRNSLEGHVRTTVKRYRGMVRAWDVVNEALWEDGELRSSILLDKMGPGFIGEAFRWAREEDPDAKLYFNDYSVLWLNPKSDGMYELVKQLLAEGVPIDGVSFQSHLTAASPPHINKILQNFQRFADLGLLLHIGELDVRIGGMTGGMDKVMAQQRQIYMTVFGACALQPACEGITTWGVSDRYTWVNDYYSTTDAPLLFDADYSEKGTLEGAILGLKATGL
jgi:endo-1,4-beta-xylanase